MNLLIKNTTRSIPNILGVACNNLIPNDGLCTFLTKLGSTSFCSPSYAGYQYGLKLLSLSC